MNERKTRGLRRGFFYTLTPPPGCEAKGIHSPSSMKKPGPCGPGFLEDNSERAALKQAVQLRVDAGNDVPQVLGVFGEAVVVDIDDQKLALVVALDPLLVALIQAL